MVTKKELFDNIYTNLLSIFPEKPWLKIINSLPHNASAQMLSEYKISYGLHIFENKSEKESDYYERQYVLDSLVFISLFLKTFNLAGESERETMRLRMQAAFSQRSEMESFLFELFIFWMIKNNGYEITHEDGLNGDGFYDFLLKDGKNRIQIECKSFTYDKGLLLKGPIANILGQRLFHELDKLKLDNIPANTFVCYTIEILETIPDSENGKAELIDQICESLRANRYDINSRFKIHVEINNNIPNIAEEDSCVNLPTDSNGIEVFRADSIPSENHGILSLRITTRIKDSFFSNFENLCKKAAKKQLPSNRPSCIAVHLYNMESLTKLVHSKRFDHKIMSIFKSRHVVSLLIVYGITVCETDEYPYFIFYYSSREILNENTIFSNLHIVMRNYI